MPEQQAHQQIYWNVRVELVAVSSPVLIMRDLMTIFPDADVHAQQLTIVNVFQAEENDIAKVFNYDEKMLSAKADSVRCFCF